MGNLVGPAIHNIYYWAPDILIQAVAITSILFGSFSAVALFTKRRSYLFLGGIISSLMSTLFWYRMVTYFFGYRFGMTTDNIPFLMVGLFVACLYIIYDTQIIIEQAERGHKDVPLHTMTLFVDLFDLFIKVLQILIKL